MARGRDGSWYFATIAFHAATLFPFSFKSDILSIRRNCLSLAATIRFGQLRRNESEQHFFTLTIKSPDEAASRVFGYWDIRDHELHIGTSESETDSAEIEIFDDSFCIVAAGGHRSEFKRKVA